MEVPAVTIIGEYFFVVSVCYKTAHGIRFWFPNVQKNVSSYNDIYYSKHDILTSWSFNYLQVLPKNSSNTHIHAQCKQTHPSSTIHLAILPTHLLTAPGIRKPSIPVHPRHQVPQTQRCTMLGLKFTWCASHPLQASKVFFGSTTSKYLKFLW